MRFFKIRDKKEGKDILHVWEDESMFCNARIENGAHGPEIRITSPGFLTDRYELIDKNFDEWHFCQVCEGRVYWRSGQQGNLWDGERYWHTDCYNKWVNDPSRTEKTPGFLTDDNVREFKGKHD